jgi:hypothetical protein
MEAFAFQVYRRFLNGETIQQLSSELEIPADRIERRLRAAAQCRELRWEASGDSESTAG